MRKYVIIFLGIIVLKATTGCYPIRGYTVESGIKGTPDNYKYFSICHLPPELQNPTIEKVLKSRLELQGYLFKDDNADFFVSYKLFYGTPHFYGYKKEKNRDLKMNTVPDNQLLNDLEQVTILILFTDHESGAVVFQTYVSGIYCSPKMEDDVRLRTAINKALDRYRFFSTNFYASFSKRNHQNRS